MREMKDSGIEWIGEIPDKWNITLLSALFRERKCKNRGMVETNLLSLSYGNIKKKDITTNEGLLPDSFETYNVINEGNIVFRLTDLQNDKKSLRTGLCKERGIITSAYVTLELEQNDDPAYIHYLFHTYDLCKVFYGMGDGVRQGANFEDLKKLKIIRPTLFEQQKISAYLDTKCTKIDSIIEKQEKVIEKLKAYKLSVITEAVTKGLNPDVKMKDSGIKWIGVINRDYKFTKIGRLCFVTKLAGFEYTDTMVRKITNDEGDVPIVRAQNVRMFKFKKEIINEYIDSDTSVLLNRCALNRKAILILCNI